VLVRGGPGIGKTALLTYAAELGSGMLVLRARGIESEAEIPFSALFDVLRPALECLDRIPSQQSASLRSAFNLGPSVRTTRFAIGAACLSLLATYAERAPVLVLVDDAQWIDASSADALAFAMRRLLAESIAVIVTERTEERSTLDSPDLPTLELRGLQEGAARALLLRHADQTVAEETTAWLYRSTAGNPLALIELAAEAPHLGVESFDLPLAVETRVERAFARQIERLSAPGRHALLIAAAAGAVELQPILDALAAAGLDSSSLEEAESVQILRIESGRLEFRHPLMRSAAYHAGTPAERRAAHRLLAETLTGPRFADQRAWHLGSASLGASQPASTALVEVAHRAMGRSAYAVAAAAFGRSAQLTADDDVRAERLVAAADAAWLSGASDQALRFLDDARSRARQRDISVEIEHMRARIALRREPVRVSYDILVRAARDIAMDDPLKAAGLLAEAAGDALMYAATVQPMLESARWAWELANSVADQEPEVAVLTRIALGQALIFSGDGAQGAGYIRRGLDVMESSPALWRDPRLVAWAGRGRLFLREGAAGSALIQRAVDIARDQGAISMLPVALNQLAVDSSVSDRWAEATAEYAEGIRLARELRQRGELCHCVAGLCRLEARQGREAACREHAAEAMALADELGMNLYRIWAHLALCQLELGLGQLESSAQHGEAADAVLTEFGIGDVDIRSAPELVEVYLRQGRRAEAEAAAEAYCELAGRKGLPWAMARAARCRGLLADDGSFEGHFVDALRYGEQNSDSFELARSHLCSGERLRRIRRRVDARHELRQAFSIFDRLGAVPWAERARLELLATGQTAHPRQGPALEELTPQEFQVAQLLARGATTREAAAKLYLSPKTVEFHLRNAYDKLGVHSRSALAELMAEEQ
jgi:DNA-binding CsgD family transcriptional regulator